MNLDPYPDPTSQPSAKKPGLWFLLAISRQYPDYHTSTRQQHLFYRTGPVGQFIVQPGAFIYVCGYRIKPAPGAVALRNRSYTFISTQFSIMDVRQWKQFDQQLHPAG